MVPSTVEWYQDGALNSQDAVVKGQSTMYTAVTTIKVTALYTLTLYPQVTIIIFHKPIRIYMGSLGLILCTCYSASSTYGHYRV